MHSRFEFRCIFTTIFFSIVFLFFVALSKINIRHGGDFLRFLALNVVFNFFNLKQHLEEDIFLKGTINTGLLSSFPDLLFQYDCRGLHSFRWARLPHTSARKVLNQLILVSRSNETLDNIVISFWNTRVNGIMMNSQAFADAFRCPLGTKMNPPNKCTTWWWRSVWTYSSPTTSAIHLTITRSLDTAWCDCGTWRARKSDSRALNYFSSTIVERSCVGGNRFG